MRYPTMPLRNLPILLLLLITTTTLSAPPDLTSLLTSARESLAAGDTDRALSLATDAVKLAPNQPSPYALRAAVQDARRDFAASIDDYTRLLSLTPDSLPALHHRGEAHFRLGHFKQSVADFDKEISLDPSREPHHWQRGISLYYAGDYARGAKQFELHRTVNPDDVENAAWHYLCVARLTGVAAARKSLLPVGPDPRVPMREIYDLFGGKATPDAVILATAAPDPPPREVKTRRFYAHLYVGLYYEAAGQAEKAREHITLAAETYAEDDYMSDVARVHAATFKAPQQ